MLESGSAGEMFEIDQSIHGRDLASAGGDKPPGALQEAAAATVEEEIIVSPKPTSSQSHIPCPRLCGFTFWGGGNGSAPKTGYGKEVGSGVVFNNGKVGDVWKWWAKKNGGGGRYPKTLRELNNAMSSYRTLQWSTPNQDDDDDESSDEDSEGEGEGGGGKEGEGRVWIASDADKEMEGWGGWGLKMGPIEGESRASCTVRAQILTNPFPQYTPRPGEDIVVLLTRQTPCILHSKQPCTPPLPITLNYQCHSSNPFSSPPSAHCAPLRLAPCVAYLGEKLLH